MTARYGQPLPGKPLPTAHIVALRCAAWEHFTVLLSQARHARRLLPLEHSPGVASSSACCAACSAGTGGTSCCWPSSCGWRSRRHGLGALFCQREATKGRACPQAQIAGTTALQQALGVAG